MRGYIVVLASVAQLLCPFAASAQPITTAESAIALAASKCPVPDWQRPSWYAEPKGEDWRVYALNDKNPSEKCPLISAEVTGRDGRVLCSLCLPRHHR